MVTFLSLEKKAELEQELEHRKTTQRNEILERLEFAKSLGDLSENAEYHTSKDDQGKNEARIRELEHLLKEAQIVEANNDGVVALGSRVIVLKGEQKKEVEYTIVGGQEADILAGKISFESPLGQALLDKVTGDVAHVETPKGMVSYTIKHVD